MKPSHLQTPRTLAECTFTTGYTSHQLRASSGVLAWAVVVCISLVSGLYLMLTA
jgi:hypothetical protein